MKYRVLHCFSVLLLMVSACKRSGEGSLIARANDQTIDAEEFRSRLSEYRMDVPTSMSSTPEETTLKKKILNELIEEKLFLSEAKKMGVQISQELVDDELKRVIRDYPGDSFDERLKQQRMTKSRYKDRIRSNLMIEKLVSTVTKNVSSPSADKIQKYYNEHAEDFHTKELYHLQQIVVKTEEDADQILDALGEGKSFQELAQNHSFASDAGQGGDLGFVTKGTMPKEVDAELTHLVVGTPSKAIESEYGFHILELLEKKPARHIPLEEARPVIVKTLTQKEREERFATWRKELLSKAKIERNHALLASIH